MPDLLERLKAALADRYAVESEVGRGGMAVVFLAKDLRHHRKVAIKVLHPELGAAVGGERFLLEIETVAGLNHPHILPLHDSGEADGLLYYVMPYVEGESLRHRLEREKQLPVDEATQIAREVAGALDHAHRHGVIHRDIKPENILLEEGHAIVTDFGVAKAVSTAGGDAVTATGMAVGTPAYMSPEQAAGEEVDERSDLYALGCVLYEMLAGEPPLVGSTPQSTAAKRLTDRATRLPALRSTVSQELDQAIQKVLERSPADRYATAPELAEALGSIISGASGTIPAWPARRRIWVGVTSAAVISMAAVAGWLSLRPSDATTTFEQNSIAVLPFVNMSDDAANEYFSDGISEELLNLLAKIPELRVTSRSSAFSFKGKDLEIPEIAARLNVAHVLEGSVRKSGDQVRITAQLIDARSDKHMWSDTWDRTLEDIFAVQDEIAADVVAQLKVTLLGAAPTVEATDPKAYALLLQARHLGHQYTPESLEQSTTLYRQALAIDPGYAAAWAGLADNYIDLAGYGLWSIDEGFGMAREAANRALVIDPENAAAYAHLSKIANSYDGDLAAAARHLERALVLEPSNPDIVREAAWLAVTLNRLDEAITLHEYAVASDPVTPAGHAFLAVSYFFAGRPDEAIVSYRTALSLSPGFPWANYMIGMALLMKDEPAAALAAMEKESGEHWRILGLSMVYHALGRADESDASLAELIDKYAVPMAYNVAYVLSFRGEADGAFEWLGRAVEYKDTGLQHIAPDIQLANIHDDPRWLPFLESIGRSPEQLAAVEFEVRLPQ